MKIRFSQNIRFLINSKLSQGRSGAALGSSGGACGGQRASQARVRSTQGGSEVLFWTTLPYGFVVFQNASFWCKAKSRRPLAEPWGLPGGGLESQAASLGPLGRPLGAQKEAKGELHENVVFAIVPVVVVKRRIFEFYVFSRFFFDRPLGGKRRLGVVKQGRRRTAMTSVDGVCAPSVGIPAECAGVVRDLEFGNFCLRV